jgi:hypothetical protein
MAARQGTAADDVTRKPLTLQQREERSRARGLVWTDEMVEEVRRLRAMGWGVNRIGDHVGVCGKSILRAYEYGVFKTMEEVMSDLKKESDKRVMANTVSVMVNDGLIEKLNNAIRGALYGTQDVPTQPWESVVYDGMLSFSFTLPSTFSQNGEYAHCLRPFSEASKTLRDRHPPGRNIASFYLYASDEQGRMTLLVDRIANRRLTVGDLINAEIALERKLEG